MIGAKGEIKEKALNLPKTTPVDTKKDAAPLEVEGLGSQGLYNGSCLVHAMSGLGGLPIHSVVLASTETPEIKEVLRKLKSVKPGPLDKIKHVIGMIDLPPYYAGVPPNVGAGIGSGQEAIRVHLDMINWVESNIVPFEKQNWTSNLIRFQGIGWTGLILGVIRDYMLASEGWSKLQYRGNYVHIANEPLRSVQNLKDFLAFSDGVNDGENTRPLVPTFDSILVSYQGKKPPAERPWEASTNFKGRITRENSEMIDQMAFAVHSKPGMKPTFKEMTQLALLSPIRTVYVSPRVQVTPIKKRFLKGNRVNEFLNVQGIRGCVNDVLEDLRENGVEREAVLLCFGELCPDFRDVVKSQVDEFGLDVKISVSGIRFGSEYSFIVGEGPVINRPRFIDEPLGVWDENNNDESEIDSLVPRGLDVGTLGRNPYKRVFDVYARALRVSDGFELFSWKELDKGA